MKYRQVEYSRTFNLGQYESERISLTGELDEDDDPDETFKTVKAHVLRLHEGRFLDEAKVQSSLSQKIAEYPWNDFKEAKGQWCFADKAPELRDELERAGGQLDFDGYTYKFSGEDKRFINRFRKK